MKGVLAGGVPLLVYVWTASGFAHWLDSGEFVAAAADFGISHPPGHPLASIVLGAANFVPFGPLAFRIAILCSTLVAIALVALFFAIERTLEASEAVRSPLITPLALGSTWWVGGTFAWWFQAVRPEVYALEAALLCIAIERLVCVSAGRGDGDVRSLYQAALAFGLALANHHYMAILAIVPTFWLLLGVWGRWGWKPFGWSAAFTAAGLLTYSFLPLRALASPYLNLGRPDSPGRFLWVVSAEAFQKSLGPERVAPFRQHLADVLVAMSEDVHIAVLFAALLGAYFMLRVRRARKFGLYWLTLWLVYTVGRALLGFVSGNPDALAYFMLAYASIAVFVAFAVGVILSALAEATPTRPRFVPVLAVLFALASLGQFKRTAADASLATFADTDVFDDGLRRNLPSNAVVLAHNPSTIFRFWGGEAEEGSRPDVTLIPLPIVTYPKMIDTMTNDDPSLTPLLRNYVLTGALNPADLQSLASLRPVFVEIDLRVPTSMYEILVPDQLFYRVQTAEITDLDEGQAMRDHGALWESLYTRLGEPIDAQTEVQLLWRHYMDALYFAAVGDINAARRSVGAGLRINPHAQELVAMQSALKKAAPGESIDITAFRAR